MKTFLIMQILISRIFVCLHGLSFIYSVCHSAFKFVNFLFTNGFQQTKAQIVQENEQFKYFRSKMKFGKNCVRARAQKQVKTVYICACAHARSIVHIQVSYSRWAQN